jgi:hypothetical protein
MAFPWRRNRRRCQCGFLTATLRRRSAPGLLRRVLSISWSGCVTRDLVITVASSSELPSEHQTPFGAAHFMSGTVISEGGNEKPQRLRVELDLVAQSERDVEHLRGSPDGELNLGTGPIGA